MTKTTKEQRDADARACADCAPDLLMDFQVSEVLAYIADAERCAELETGIAAKEDTAKHWRDQYDFERTRAETAEAARDTLRRLLDVAVGALRQISEAHDNPQNDEIAAEAIAQIEKEMPK